MSENENITPETEAEEATTEADATSPEAVIAELTAEIDTLRDDKLRALADAQNTRRRAEKEISDARVYSVSNFAKDMLDVADNLSRALAALDPEQLETASEGLRNLVEGIAMTEKSLLSKMERHGVKMIDPAPGDVFDPNRHQAVAQIPSDQPSGKIANVMQTGFVIGDRTLRAAMVAVSAGQPGGSPTGDAGGNVDLKA
ncbi:nucleotide exchange factor GrpE [Maricaulis parjimensis]|uniref:nucleotide exchange factor GrpE n=1 Tax=Maricaulis parjimensis TaxID=144023 RepID=UPI001939CA76|nr:nucleotide exchange factor GrpE [Maricaulis parjimensis]